MTTAGNRGDAIDLMVQGMTPPAQCVTGQGDLLVSNGSWPNEFGPTTEIYPLDLGKSPSFYTSLQELLLVKSKDGLNISSLI
jgi:hypothetical protein